MQSCPKCLVLYTNINDSVSVFSEQLSAVPHHDESKLTVRVMDAMRAKTASTSQWKDALEIMMAALRPGMTVAAILLAGFFVMEVTRTPHRINSSEGLTGSVKLDRTMTAGLAAQWLDTRSKAGTSTLHCIHECQKINGKTCIECLSNN
jgi:hypothetical protein